MTKLTTRFAMFAALLAGGLIALPALAESKPAKKEAGVLRVYDEAHMFSETGKRNAESHMSRVSFDHGLTLTIDTHPALPAERKPEFDAAKDDAERTQVFNAWARSLFTGDKATGIYVLINRSPRAVVVLTDKETRNRGFTAENEHKLHAAVRNGLMDAANKPEAEKAAARDRVLVSAVDFVVADLKGTHVTTTAEGAPLGTKSDTKKAGMSVGGWICLGLCILLGVWLVIGVIRALTGGGGGGGGGYGGGGGGGGGFGSSMLGGLFGAMAGMWLYNSMFGGHSGMMGGNDAYAGDSSTGAEGDTGSGDLADDTGSSSYDGGDYGGGDSGGGGGDWGGGGDFGGGGGDFGGDF